jgi:hypothetical protein
MRTWCIGLVILAALGCSEKAPPDVEPPPLEIRAQWDPANPDPVQDALGIWRHGADYFPDGDERYGVPSEFALGEWTWAFLAKPSLTPFVQFSCSPTVGQDPSIEAAMLEGKDPDRLVALALLMRVRAPDSVDKQRDTLDALSKRHPEWASALAELRVAFEPAPILAALAKDPPTDWHDDAAAHCWAIRAAAITGLDAAIPRLGELSTVHVLDLSLTAVKSLEESTGEAADRALAQCVLGWQYDAFEHAARALRKRNLAVLHEALLSAEPPEDRRYDYGIFLAWCDDTKAVPILCDTVKGISFGAKWNVDHFELIEKLATKDQLSVIEALPGNVRPDQRERAEAVVAAVKERLGVK